MKKFLLVACFSCAAILAAAQSAAFTRIDEQSNISAPWGLSNLSIIDGKLYGWGAGGMMEGVFSAKGELLYLQPSHWLNAINGEMTYAIRHPQDSMIYYTVRTGKGVRLYCHQEGHRRSSEVAVFKWDEDIMHPTFSKDGSLMVFSARAGGGRADYDLWASRWDGKNWGKPFNLGKRINTSANEIQPHLLGDNLLFSSNRVGASPSGYDLYSVFSMADSNSWQETNLPSVAYRLPMPINTVDDEFALASNVSADVGYWVRKNGGNVQLFRFDGPLDGIMYCGFVMDVEGRPLADTRIVVSYGGKTLYCSQTDSSGRYYLFCHPGGCYDVTFSHPGYTHTEISFSESETSNSQLIQEKWKNVTLKGCPINTPVFLNNLFGEGVGTAITPTGQKELAPYVAYLHDNPTTHIIIVVQCSQTGDAEYDDILTRLRVNELRVFFASRLPEGSSISVQNGNDLTQNKLHIEDKNTVMMVLRHFE